MATSRAGKAVSNRTLLRNVDCWKRISLRSKLTVKYVMGHTLQEMDFQLPSITGSIPTDQKTVPRVQKSSKKRKPKDSSNHDKGESRKVRRLDLPGVPSTSRDRGGGDIVIEVKEEEQSIASKCARSKSEPLVVNLISDSEDEDVMELNPCGLASRQQQQRSVDGDDRLGGLGEEEGNTNPSHECDDESPESRDFLAECALHNDESIISLSPTQSPRQGTCHERQSLSGKEGDEEHKRSSLRKDKSGSPPGEDNDGKTGSPPGEDNDGKTGSPPGEDDNSKTGSPPGEDDNGKTGSPPGEDDNGKTRSPLVDEASKSSRGSNSGK